MKIMAITKGIIGASKIIIGKKVETKLNYSRAERKSGVS